MGQEIKEIWNPIKNYEGFYAVSNLGNVKRLTSFTRHRSGSKKIVRERILKQANCNGYRIVMITIDGSRLNKMVHRLVAESFLNNPENKKHVNHKNGIKHDNCLENLEWNTPKENEQHKVHVLGKIKTPLNLKNVYKVNEPITINGRQVVGINIQNFYNDLINGKAISARDKSYGNIYTLKYLLKTKYNVPIESRTVNGNFKEYFLNLNN